MPSRPPRFRPLLLALLAALPALPQAAPRELFGQDFEALPVGPPPAGLLTDNTWTGDKASYRLVDTNALGGRALQVEVNNFAQCWFARGLRLQAGKTYRVRGTVASAGPKTFEVLLRREGAPYTAYVTVQDTANEAWKAFDFVVESRESAEGLLLMMLVHGQGAFWLGELHVDEAAGPPPAQTPPRLGNLVQNSSFELGWDGWAVRDESGWSAHHTPGSGELDEGLAVSGRRSLRLSGDAVLSCPFAPIAYGQTYTVSAMVRADYPDARLQLSAWGPASLGGGRPVPEGRWQRVQVTGTFQTPRGLALREPYASVRLVADTPPGKHVWLDDVDLRAGDAAPYAPRAPRELALTTDQPANLVLAGRPFRLLVTGVAPRGATAWPPVTIELHDEHGLTVRTWDKAALQPEAGAAGPGLSTWRGEVGVDRLPPGYWRFATRGPDAAAEGEALVSAVPELPHETPFAWQLGAHVSQYRPFGAVHARHGLRWTRLHDVCIATKWHFLEPVRGQWRWAEADAQVDAYRAEGYRVLGLLDGVPGWRRPDGRPANTAMHYPDRDFADWAHYVRETVAHFRGRVDAWEVMNEPGFAGPGPDKTPNAAWYVELLKVAWQAAKAADPAAFIVGGGGNGAPVRGDATWQSLLDAGLLPYCDAVSYHGYGYATTQVLDGPAPLVEFMTWLRGEMTRRIGRTLPVWDSEVGLSPKTSSRKFWWPQKGPDEPHDAARAAVAGLLAERAAGVEKTFCYAAFPARLYEDGSLWMFADVNGQLTPVAVALGVAAQQSEGLAPVGVDTPAPHVTVLELRGPGLRRWAVWTLRDRCAVTLNVPRGAAVTAVGMYGRDEPVRRAGETVTVTAGPWPCYVTAR